MTEVMVLVPGYTVQSLKMKIEQCFIKICEEKVTSEQNYDVNDILGVISDDDRLDKYIVYEDEANVIGDTLKVEAMDIVVGTIRDEVEVNVVTKIKEEDNQSENTINKGKGTRRSKQKNFIDEDSSIRRKLSFCSECMKHVSKLGKHTRRVHLKMKQFICNLCEKKFFDKRDLERHSNGIHEDNKIICQECGLSFKRIQAHIQNVHRDKIVKEICLSNKIATYYYTN